MKTLIKALLVGATSLALSGSVVNEPVVAKGNCKENVELFSGAQAVRKFDINKYRDSGTYNLGKLFFETSDGLKYEWQGSYLISKCS